MLCEPLVLSGLHLEFEGAPIAIVGQGQCGECGMEHPLPLASPGDLVTQQTCRQDLGEPGQGELHKYILANIS